MEKATTEQVREYYKAKGYDVRISDDGHVEFRPQPVRGHAWREGRWVSEYRVIEGQVILT